MPDILWFVKAARARTTDDSETWREGGVTPTLNIFDNNGDTRATVLIAYSIREDAGGAHSVQHNEQPVTRCNPISHQCNHTTHNYSSCRR